jgi:hypothetical protein
MAACLHDCLSQVATPDNGPVQTRSWRVLHVCENPGDVAPLIEGQLAASMRPSVVTPEGPMLPGACLEQFRQEKAHPASLLTAWADVRQWRKAMLDVDPHGAAEIVYAHSFASGMAAVRNCPAVVYDIASFVEQAAAASADSAHDAPGAWLSRSFRVAEQFVISRASAVVVHADSMMQAVLERGADAENLFCIPAPLSRDLLDACESFVAPQRENAVEFFVPGSLDSDFGASANSVANGRIALLRNTLIAMSLVATEVDGVTVVLECEQAVPGRVIELGEGVCLVADSSVAGFRLKTAASPSLAPSLTIRLAGRVDRQRNLASCDVVITSSDGNHGDHGNDEAGLLAMAYGRPLLASDTAAQRDISPEGRGCLWYRADDLHDLARRASFLARNCDFRRVLGEAGRRHLLETRTPVAVAQQYDAVYRRVSSRRKNAGTHPPSAVLQHMLCCS